MAGVEAQKNLKEKERGLEGNVSKRQGDRHHVNELDPVRFAYGKQHGMEQTRILWPPWRRSTDGHARFYGKGIGLTLLITAAA